MYLEAIKIFCDVVRQRSFSRAASANRISQSAASQNVLQLEKTLGVRLIDRSKRPFKLTAEGEVYYEGCKGLVERYYAVEAEVKSIRNEMAGTVSVAAIYSVGLVDMSRHVQQFRSQFPRANVRLAYLHPDRVVESVINEEVDIGLVSYPKAGRGLAALPWREEPMVVVVSRIHRLASRSAIEPADLSGENFVGFDDALVIRGRIDRELRRLHVDVNVVMTFDNIETIKRAVEIDEGVSVLPEPAVRAEVRAGALKVISMNGMTLVRSLGIVHRKSGVMPRAVQRFVSFLQAGHRTDSKGQAEVAGERAEKIMVTEAEARDNGKKINARLVV